MCVCVCVSPLTPERLSVVQEAQYPPGSLHHRNSLDPPKSLPQPGRRGRRRRRKMRRKRRRGRGGGGVGR